MNAKKTMILIWKNKIQKLRKVLSHYFREYNKLNKKFIQFKKKFTIHTKLKKKNYNNSIKKKYKILNIFFKNLKSKIFQMS